MSSESVRVHRSRLDIVPDYHEVFSFCVDLYNALD
jgi:hypothetical protein